MAVESRNQRHRSWPSPCPFTSCGGIKRCFNASHDFLLLCCLNIGGSTCDSIKKSSYIKRTLEKRVAQALSFECISKLYLPPSFRLLHIPFPAPAFKLRAPLSGYSRLVKPSCKSPVPRAHRHSTLGTNVTSTTRSWQPRVKRRHEQNGRRHWTIRWSTRQPHLSFKRFMHLPLFGMLCNDQSETTTMSQPLRELEVSENDPLHRVRRARKANSYGPSIWADCFGWMVSLIYICLDCIVCWFHLPTRGSKHRAYLHLETRVFISLARKTPKSLLSVKILESASEREQRRMSENA